MFQKILLFLYAGEKMGLLAFSLRKLLSESLINTARCVPCCERVKMIPVQGSSINLHQLPWRNSMRSRILLSCLAASAIFLSINAGASGQAPPEPSPEHKLLAEDVGTWDATMKMWMGGPDASPMEATATEVNTMFGPYFISSEFKGELGDQKFEGRGTFGYDPVKKKYVGTWLDTMSPFISQMEGTYDAATKTMTMMGDTMDPEGRPTKSKNVTVTNPDGTRTFTMYMIPADAPDKPIKMMEIHYKKR
jgi:hypothetical protein